MGSCGAENIIGKCYNDKYVVLKKIGVGSFGQVYLCKNKYARSQLYAVKILPMPKDGRQHHSVDPMAEIEIHRRLSEKNGRLFVKVLDDFELDDAVVIVMEYCEEGSLEHFVIRDRGAPMEILLATDVLLQLVDALKLMHASGIMHRDLSAGNVLVKEVSRGQNGDVKRLHVKVTDFGLSKRDVQGQLRTMLGTPAFMAPEVRAGKYTMAADVFSLGAIFYLLLTRKLLPSVATTDQQQQQI
uniref:Protein kinase domain-containing protein n=1 Tax=Globodera rostochiensis TaxID=31243 RepID=A0A914HBP4_GLORO